MLMDMLLTTCLLTSPAANLTRPLCLHSFEQLSPCTVTWHDTKFPPRAITSCKALAMMSTEREEVLDRVGGEMHSMVNHPCTITVVTTNRGRMNFCHSFARKQKCLGKANFCWSMESSIIVRAVGVLMLADNLDRFLSFQ